MRAPSMDKTTSAGRGTGRTERMLVPEDRSGRSHWGGTQRDGSQYLRQDMTGPSRMGYMGTKPETLGYITDADQDSSGRHTYGNETTRDLSHHMNAGQGSDARLAHNNHRYYTGQDNSSRDTVGMMRRGLYTNRMIDPRWEAAQGADADRGDVDGVGMQQGEFRSALRAAGETAPKHQSLTSVLFEEMGYLNMEVARGAGPEAVPMRDDAPSDVGTAGQQGAMREGASKTEWYAALVAQRKGDWGSDAPFAQDSRAQQPAQQSMVRASSIRAPPGHSNSAVAHT